jgi:hypothetical protein
MLEDPYGAPSAEPALAYALWCRSFRRRLREVLLLMIVAIVAGLALGAIFARPAHAGREAVEFDCGELALVIYRIADFRDTGADLERVVRLAHEQNAEVSRAHREVIEREIRRLWKERQPAEEAAARLFRRCRAQLGDMGYET